MSEDAEEREEGEVPTEGLDQPPLDPSAGPLQPAGPLRQAGRDTITQTTAMVGAYQPEPLPPPWNATGGPQRIELGRRSPDRLHRVNLQGTRRVIHSIQCPVRVREPGRAGPPYCTTSEDLHRDLAEHSARCEGDRTDPAAEEVFQQDIVSLRIKHVEYTALCAAKCAAEAAAKETAKTSMRKHILALAPITTMGNNKPWAALVTWAKKYKAQSVGKAMAIAPAMNSE